MLTTMIEHFGLQLSSPDKSLSKNVQSLRCIALPVPVIECYFKREMRELHQRRREDITQGVLTCEVTRASWSRIASHCSVVVVA